VIFINCCNSSPFPLSIACHATLWSHHIPEFFYQSQLCWVLYVKLVFKCTVWEWSTYPVVQSPPQSRYRTFPLLPKASHAPAQPTWFNHLQPQAPTAQSGFCYYSFAFSRISYKQNHTAYSLPHLASFSLSMFLRFTILLHVSVVHFFFDTEKYCIVKKYYNLVIHSPVDRYLNCFQLLATVNDIAINIHVYISVDTCFYFSYVNI
jgi:hypothetical protein